MTEPRSESCSSCPYRRDVPSGVWSFEEYEKLRDYDLPTAQQPWATFMCHATPDHYCAGWVNVHMNRGADPNDRLSRHPYDLFALRLARSRMEWDGTIPNPRPDLYFVSGNEAADHGQRDIAVPGDAAVSTVARLQRKYPRLRNGES